MPSTIGNMSWTLVQALTLTFTNIYVLVIPQYEYNILVITQVRGEAEDVDDN